MPKLETVTELADGLAIGVRRKKNPDGTMGAPKWYSRHYFPGEPGSYYFSLRLDVEVGHANFREAEKRAREKHRLQQIKAETGAPQTAPLDIRNITNAYLDEWLNLAQHNERLIKQHEEDGKKGRPLNLIEVKHGKNHYTLARYKAVLTMCDKLQYFWDTLPTTVMPDIRNRDLDGFLEWARTRYQWSPSRIMRHITQIRMIFLYAYDQGIVNYVPTPRRPKEELRIRKRRCFTETEYKRLVDYAERNYKEIIVREDGRNQERKDLAFQFLCFIQFCAWIGFRPPTGVVKKNLLKWESLIIKNEGQEDEKRLFRRIDEKDHPMYEAPVGREVWALFDALKALYKARGISDSEYLFAHTFDNGARYSAGGPILNFKKQWKTALEYLELDTDSEERRHRLTPYSLRSYHITMRIRYGNVNIYDLAQSLGTSMRMIQDAYDDYSTEAKWDVLTEGQKAERNYTTRLDANGNLIL